VILVDSNIPMYLVGGSHPHTVDAQRSVEKLLSERQRLVTDAEVLQEILHRFVALNLRDAIQPAFDSLLGVVDEVLSIDPPSSSVLRGSSSVKGDSRRAMQFVLQ
jgi:predicted nucleic acid-binding protein